MRRRQLHRALCDELRADGHTVQRATTPKHATTLLAGQPLDVLLLATLEQPTDALELLRELRAGRLPGHARADLPVVTVGASRELDALRAYDAGSDHHVPADASYLLLAAAITAVLRRSAATPMRRCVGALEIDPDTRQVRVRGELVELDVDGVPTAVRAGSAADARPLLAGTDGSVSPAGAGALFCVGAGLWTLGHLLYRLRTASGRRAWLSGCSPPGSRLADVPVVGRPVPG